MPMQKRAPKSKKLRRKRLTVLSPRMTRMVLAAFFAGVRWATEQR